VDLATTISFIEEKHRILMTGQDRCGWKRTERDLFSFRFWLNRASFSPSFEADLNARTAAALFVAPPQQ
jgi:hypothetical protein